MKRYSYYRIPILLSVLLLSANLSACDKKLDSATINNLNISYISNTDTSKNQSPGDTSPSEAPVASLSPVQDLTTEVDASANSEEMLSVRGVTIAIGESKESIVGKLGQPNRIDETEYDFEYYIYNSNYNKLLFVAMKNDEVVGFYSDSLDFNYQGIRSGSDLDAVEKAFGKTLDLDEVLTHTTDQYTINVLMDKIGTHKATGIYVLSNSVKQDEYTEETAKNVELEVYDLTNSVRVRNNEALLSWSSSAALASRKHSHDMAENNYFNHVDLKFRKPGDRMRSEGISYRTCGENIIAGYGGSILSTHGWFNSSGHRNIMLNSKFRYLGVGFTYKEDSRYHTYITQNFYR